MKQAELWRPPGKNCGLCGCGDCGGFIGSVTAEEKAYDDCPFFRKQGEKHGDFIRDAVYRQLDVLGNPYDFVLKPLPGEISPRKIVLPFRADLVEKMAIRPGDVVMGRPMGAGCPIPHVQEVIEADPVTGVIVTWVIGLKFSRGREVKDVKAYHMIGFEGVPEEIRREPVFGNRMTFLPGCCMMNLNHTGLINMVLQKNYGLHIRIEDIRIMAGPKS